MFKRLCTLLLTAMLALTVLAGCGRSNSSKEAASAANRAQDTVHFETDSALTKALEDALEDNVQTSAVRDAMAADKRLQDLLSSGYRLDVFAVTASDAKTAAAAIAQNVAGITAGKQAEGKIAMVQADNGYYYAAVLTWQDSSGGGSGPDGEEDVTAVVLESISVTTSDSFKSTYTVGDTFSTTGLTVTAQYNSGKTETVTDYTCSYGVLDSSSIQKVTITYQEKTAEVTITVNPRLTVNMENARKEFTKGESFSAIHSDIDVIYEEILNQGEKITYPAYYTITPETFTESGESIPVTLTYYNNSNVTATVHVKVVDPPPISGSDNATLQGQLTNIHDLFLTEAKKYTSYAIGDNASGLQTLLNQQLDQHPNNSSALAAALTSSLKPTANVAINANTGSSFINMDPFEAGVTEEKYYMIMGMSTTHSRLSTAMNWLSDSSSTGGKLADRLSYIDGKLKDIEAKDPYGENSFTIYFSITDVNGTGLDYKILVERTRTPKTKA